MRPRAPLPRPESEEPSSPPSPGRGSAARDSSDSAPLPPWKRELLLRRSALARTVEPNLSLVCRKLQGRTPLFPNSKERSQAGKEHEGSPPGGAGGKGLPAPPIASSCEWRPLHGREGRAPKEREEAPLQRKARREASAAGDDGRQRARPDPPFPAPAPSPSPSLRQASASASPPSRPPKGQFSERPRREETCVAHNEVKSASKGASATPSSSSSSSSSFCVEWDTFEWEDSSNSNNSKKEEDDKRSGGHLATFNSRSRLKSDRDLVRENPAVTDDKGTGEDERTSAMTSKATSRRLAGAASSSTTSSSSSSGSAAEDDINRAAARIYRSKAVSRRPAAYAAPGAAAAAAAAGVSGHHQLDSDGTLNSGGDSDSSEEIHYGPGFVSRLKNRYMSVALRSSTRGSTASILRRTASLEDFLDKDKEDQHIELRGSRAAPLSPTKPSAPTLHHYSQHQQRHRPSDTPDGSSSRRSRPPSTAKSASRRKDSIKRAQSVEVLSVSDQTSSSSGSSSELPVTSPTKLSRRYAFEKHDAAPPPLPPKGKERSIDKVVNSLANDVAIVEKTMPKKSSSSSAIQPPPLAKVMELGGGSVSRRPPYKRRSSSLLFGVEERELPAPDTVKETRKIFESRPGRAPLPSYGSKSQQHPGLGHKSKSASSLHPPRSRSVDARLFARKRSSDTDSLSMSSPPPPPASRPSQTVAPQPSPRSHGNQAKPSLPSKPAHLTPSKSPTAPLKTRRSEEILTAAAATTSHFVMPPLRHVSKQADSDETSSTTSSSSSSVGGGRGRDRGGSSSVRSSARPSVKTVEESEDEGIKHVSSDSISRIRQGSSSVSFNFNGAGVGSNSRNYLPSKESGSAAAGRQVGVIRPITRESIRESQQHQAEKERPKEVIYIEKKTLQMPSSPTASAPQAPAAKSSWMEEANRKNRRLAAAAAKHDQTVERGSVVHHHRVPSRPTHHPPAVPPQEPVRETSVVSKTLPEPKKPEVLLVTKKDLPASPKLLRRQTNVEAEAPSAGGGQRFVPSPERLIVSSSPPSEMRREIMTRVEAKSSSTSAGVVDDGSNSSSSSSSSPQPMMAAAAVDVGAGENSYRDSWKKRNEEQNTMVFNFVNSAKEVSHIENDGRDISKRRGTSGKSKKRRNIALAKVGIRRKKSSKCRFVKFGRLRSNIFFILPSPTFAGLIVLRKASRFY